MFVVAKGSSNLFDTISEDILLDNVRGVECRRAMSSRAFLPPVLVYKGVFVRFGSISKLVSSLLTTVVLRPDNLYFLSSASVSKRTTVLTFREEQHAENPFYAINK